jgi:pimeloyl-ACP methyl ester carboxylesterase
VPLLIRALDGQRRPPWPTMKESVHESTRIPRGAHSESLFAAWQKVSVVLLQGTANRKEYQAIQSFSFILIPGAGGSAWYWHLVAPKLQERGHEAVPVELPAADDRAGLPQYAATIVRAIGNRDPRRVVLVGQSLAGFTLPLVCKKVRVAMLVLVNAMIPKPGESPGEWWGNTGHGEAKRQQNVRDGRRADAPFDPLVDFFHDVPQPVVDNARAQGEPRQSETVFGSPCTFKAWPAVPTRVLVGRDDRFFPAEFQRRVARERLGIAADDMVGGHLLALSQPAELSTRLIAYVSTSERSRR